MADSVEDILAGAKETLNKANALSDSVEKEKQKTSSPEVSHLPTPPKHEYSNAPYSLIKEADSVGKGLKARIEMEAKARKALQ